MERKSVINLQGFSNVSDLEMKQKYGIFLAVDIFPMYFI